MPAGRNQPTSEELGTEQVGQARSELLTAALTPVTISTQFWRPLGSVLHVLQAALTPLSQRSACLHLSP